MGVDRLPDHAMIDLLIPSEQVSAVYVSMVGVLQSLAFVALLVVALLVAVIVRSRLGPVRSGLLIAGLAVLLVPHGLGLFARLPGSLGRLVGDLDHPFGGAGWLMLSFLHLIGLGLVISAALINSTRAGLGGQPRG